MRITHIKITKPKTKPKIAKPLNCLSLLPRTLSLFFKKSINDIFCPDSVL